MRNNKTLLILMVVLLGIILIVTFNRPPSNFVSYSIYLTPDEESEITMIIPVVMDNKSGEIDQVMFINPRYQEGKALLEIIDTSKGPALKIITHDELQIDFSKRYEESGVELLATKTFSMTEITYDEIGEPTRKCWVYFNSSTNQTQRFWFILSAGDRDRSHSYEISGRNFSNGWHQLTFGESIGIA